MHRFYVPCENIIEGRVIISDARQIHHIKDVLRLKIKDEIVLFDEKTNECKGLIEDKIIIEIKAVDIMPKIYEKQLYSYLKATKYKIGILVNFGGYNLDIKRRILG